jgi:hypothetical protein
MDASADQTLDHTEGIENVDEHPGLPWFCWQPGSGHLGYHVLDKEGQAIQCPYIRYSMQGGTPIELGTEGARKQEYI